MRKAFIYLVLPLLCLCGFHAGAQSDTWIHADGEFLRRLQKRDSILIGDQLEYGFKMEGMVDGTVLGFPKLSQSALEQINDDWKIKLLSRKSQGEGIPDLLDIEASITLAAFEEGTYELPPLIIGRVLPSGAVDTLYFDPVDEFEVKTVPVDTATFIPHEMKSLIEVPYTWDEFLYDLDALYLYIRDHLLVWLISGRWLVILIIVGICISRIRSSKTGSASRVTIVEPAHIVALRRLDGLRSNAMWVPEKQKAFYSGVTDALREYISQRYGVGAMEMTTAELMNALAVTEVSKETQNELKSLFERADYVKFAKYVASDEDNASTVPTAVRFVTQTYQADLTAQQQQDKNDEDKKE